MFEELTDGEIQTEERNILSYDDKRNLEYEIERQYKISKGYDKMGFDWAYTDEDRRVIRFRKVEEVEWILMLGIARAAEAKRDKQWIEWGEEFCYHVPKPAQWNGSRRKRRCPHCWQELRNQLEK